MAIIIAITITFHPLSKKCITPQNLSKGYHHGSNFIHHALAVPSTAATSCNGGLSGLGETGDARVPKLIGVGCVDMNLVVDLPTLEAHADYGAFR